MKLVIEISLDGAAFEDGGAEEVARILADLASRIPDPLDQTGGTLSLHDANGNNCGHAEIVDGEHPAVEALRDCKGFLEAYQMQLEDSGKKPAAAFVARSLDGIRAAIA